MGFISKTLFILSFFTVLSSISYGAERKLFTGAGSSEANLNFTTTVKFRSPTIPSENLILDEIDAQVEHLFGPMSEADFPAAPKGDHKIKLIAVTQKTPGSQIYYAEYNYSGTIVVKDNAPNPYDVILPISPDLIYSQAGRGLQVNPCTDEHYQSEGDFWYFWSPFKRGCKLIENVHYVKVPAKLTYKKSPQETYPEYHRLVNEEGHIRISLLMGMDDPSKDRDPNTSDDINADNFRQIKQTLTNMGYASQIIKKSDLRSALPFGTTLPYVEFFYKIVEDEIGQKRAIIVQVFFGPTGITEDSKAFHYFYKDAIENSSVMMYDGHSGLGGHLDLDSIEQNRGFKINFNKEKYQIFFFNSCSSYSYYNKTYFAKKRTQQDPRGIKNLDILANGLSTYFNVMHDTNLSLIKAIELFFTSQATVSYKALANEIDSNNLFGVNGDQDNPTDPELLREPQTLPQ